MESIKIIKRMLRVSVSVSKVRTKTCVKLLLTWESTCARACEGERERERWNKELHRILFFCSLDAIQIAYESQRESIYVCQSTNICFFFLAWHDWTWYCWRAYFSRARECHILQCSIRYDTITLLARRVYYILHCSREMRLFFFYFIQKCCYAASQRAWIETHFLRMQYMTEIYIGPPIYWWCDTQRDKEVSAEPFSITLNSNGWDED